jgi:hypothetical protein
MGVESAEGFPQDIALLHTPYFESKSSVITCNARSIDNVTDLPIQVTSTSTDLAVLIFILYLLALLLDFITSLQFIRCNFGDIILNYISDLLVLRAPDR